MPSAARAALALLFLLAPAHAAVQLKLNNSTAAALSIDMENDAAVAGYQFNVVRAPAGARIEASIGSLTEDAGFDFSYSEHGDVVLAFSLTGDVIPSRESFGPLMAFSTDTSGLYCVDKFLFSDPQAQQILVAIEDNCAIVVV